MRIAKKTNTTKITKSATRFKRVGNFLAWHPVTWKYISELPNRSILNAYGLTNDGVDICAEGMVEPIRSGHRIIPNFFPEFSKGLETAIDEIREAVDIYRHKLASAFWAMELNISCPNSREKVEENIGHASQCVRMLKTEFPWLTVIVKLSILHPYELAEEMERINPDIIIHAINSVPYGMVYSGVSPIRSVGGGGVSGPESFSQAFAYNKGLRQKIKAKMIMGNGADTRLAVKEYLDIGADSVSICSAVRRNSKEAAMILEVYNG